MTLATIKSLSVLGLGFNRYLGVSQFLQNMHGYRLRWANQLIDLRKLLTS